MKKPLMIQRQREAKAAKRRDDGARESKRHPWRSQRIAGEPAGWIHPALPNSYFRLIRR